MQMERKKAGAIILISDNVDLIGKTITRDKEIHYIMIQGSVQEEDTTIVNIYAPNTGAPQYIRQTLTDIKEETGSNTMILGDFNAPLTPMDRSSKQKINRETQVLNDTLENMALIDILGHSIQMQKNIPFLKSTWNILRIDPILGHKSDLGEFKKIEIISSIFSDHNTVRLDISYKNKTVKNTNTWGLNNAFLNMNRLLKKSKGNLKIPSTK